MSVSQARIKFEGAAKVSLGLINLVGGEISGPDLGMGLGQLGVDPNRLLEKNQRLLEAPLLREVDAAAQRLDGPDPQRLHRGGQWIIQRRLDINPKLRPLDVLTCPVQKTKWMLSDGLPYGGFPAARVAGGGTMECSALSVERASVELMLAWSGWRWAEQ